MIPRVKKDYERSLEELDDLLVVLESDEAIQSSAMFAKAKELLNEKKLFFVCLYAITMYSKSLKRIISQISIYSLSIGSFVRMKRLLFFSIIDVSKQINSFRCISESHGCETSYSEMPVVTGSCSHVWRIQTVKFLWNAAEILLY